ncbi:MAG: T9SS type A sorting domain-containing protein [Crocinitomicaceae bacterium]
MKKIYLMAFGLLLSLGLNAQITISNSGFENWDGAPELDPTSWHYPTFGLGTADTLLGQGFTCTVGASTTPGAVNEITTGSPEGASHCALTTSTFTNGGTVYLYPGEIITQSNSTDAAYEVTFQYRANMQPNDTAEVFVLAYNGSFQGTAYAEVLFTSADNAGTFQTATATFVGNFTSLAGYQITVKSSIAAVPIEGSTLEIDDFAISTATIADPAMNVVGADISDNGDGSDLEVTFDAATDETTVSTYRVLAITAGSSLLDYSQAGLPYVDVTPDGSASYTVNFTAVDQYVEVVGTSASLQPIVENVDMDIIVVSSPDGTNANTLSTSTSANPVTLTSSSGASIGEVEKNLTVVYPNPANQEVNFKFGENQKVSVVNIMDITGKMVNTVTVNGQNILTVDVNELSEGMYLYQVIGANGEVITTNKFVVAR